MPTLPNARALVIGIANYQAINSLPSTVLKDAQDMADLLVDQSVCGYARANVHLLLDGQATQAAIRQELASLAHGADADSTVLFYISSHGGRIESGPYAGEYLLPVDTRFTSDQKLAETAISGTEFTAALRAIPAGKLLVVFDCCHSGGIGQPKDATAPAFKAGLPDSYYDALKAGRGRAILASSRSTEYSWVLTGDTNSLFTKHLLAGLRGGIAAEDGLIRIFDLFEYLQPRVTGDRKDQHPIFKAE
ncbi:MAG: caspase family protein, partial [Anaerolineae bacterium]